jgi:glucose-6-phosphate 1-epimerase
MQGLRYKDKLKAGQSLEETGAELVVSGEVHRKHQQSPMITLQASGMRDVVVWNPWVEKAKAMADFGDLEYREMICLEAGSVDGEVRLQAEQSWTAEQEIIYLQL